MNRFIIVFCVLLIAISFGYKDTKTRNSEMMSLFDYGFSQYTSKVFLKEKQIVKRVSIPNSNIDKINLLVKDEVNATYKIGAAPSKYTYYIELKNISFPIKKGDTIGYLHLKKDDKEIKTIDLITDTDIRKASFFKQYFKVIIDMFSGNI